MKSEVEVHMNKVFFGYSEWMVKKKKNPAETQKAEVKSSAFQWSTQGAWLRMGPRIMASNLLRIL